MRGVSEHRMGRKGVEHSLKVNLKNARRQSLYCIYWGNHGNMALKKSAGGGALLGKTDEVCLSVSRLLVWGINELNGFSKDISRYRDHFLGQNKWERSQSLNLILNGRWFCWVMVWPFFPRRDFGPVRKACLSWPKFVLRPQHAHSLTPSQNDSVRDKPHLL